MFKNSVLSFFLKHYRAQTLTLYAAQLLAGVLEALSIAALLPLLSIIIKDEGAEDSSLYSLLDNIFSLIGMETTLGNVTLFIVVIFGIKAAVKYGVMYYISNLFARIVMDFRKELLDALLYSKWSFYTHRPVGHFLNALFVEAQRCGGIYKTMGSLIAAFLQMGALFIATALLSWEIALASIVCGLLVWILLYRYIRITGETGTQQKDAAKDINAQVADLLQHYKPLKAMHVEKTVFARVQNDIFRLYKISFRQLMAKESTVVFREFFLVILAAGGLYLAFQYFDIAAAELFMMVAIFYRLMTSAGQAQHSYQTYCGQRSFFISFREFTDSAGQNRETLQEGSPSSLEKNIVFKDVSFFYDAKQILNAVNFEIPAYKLIALTGPSGTGKTTILDLICGLHIPQKGQILIDGKDLAQINRYDWRNHIGYVPQEFVVLHDTIYNNISLNNPDISRDDAIEALKKAEAWDFVEKLPNGIDTMLGERGSLISGGQRQRISIARALARKPRLLIMDEATASLDPKTEKEILAMLKECSKEMTIIAISHQQNLHSVADTVIDLEAVNTIKT